MINKILVIDDNIIFCNALKYHLSQKEYVVETCISHTELLDKDIKEFDLFLLDIKLKDEQGFDIFQYILNMCPEKKIIITSSCLDNEYILKANQLGAYKCIPKSSKLFEELDIAIKEI